MSAVMQEATMVCIPGADRGRSTAGEGVFNLLLGAALQHHSLVSVILLFNNCYSNLAAREAGAFVLSAFAGGTEERQT